MLHKDLSHDKSIFHLHLWGKNHPRAEKIIHVRQGKKKNQQTSRTENDMILDNYNSCRPLTTYTLKAVGISTM